MHALDQDRLNVVDKTRANVFNWRGQFTPQLVDYLLEVYATGVKSVADPFCGSGTVLLEAASRKIAAYGTELNPAAYAMAKFSTLASLSLRERTDLASTVDGYLRAAGRTFGDMPLWTTASDYREKAKNLLGLGRHLFDICQTKRETLLVALLLFEGEGCRSGDLMPNIRRVFARIRTNLMNLPYLKKSPAVWLCDARLCDSVLRAECDLILTSPPYINVFNYHQNHRAIVELLGFDILKVAHSEIGANRKNRQNRFRTVVQYCLEMEQCLHTFSNILAQDGRAVMILGRESNVRGIPFRNGEMVAAIATQSGLFTLDSQHERRFTNRFGVSIVEDILVLSRAGAANGSNVSPSIAEKHLKRGLRRAEKDVASDIIDALESLPTIAASGILERTPIL